MKPLLAAPADLHRLQFPVYGSAKLDGIRALVKDGVLVSRNLRPIPNAHLQKMFGRKCYNGLDGELIAGEPTTKHVFQATTSAVMSCEGKPEVWFHVFDDFSTPERAYVDRLARLKKRLRGEGGPLILVHQDLLPDLVALDIYELDQLQAGYEGVMLRDPAGIYKYGRCTTAQGMLVKLKRFNDSEATVLGFEPLRTNTNEAKRNALGQLGRSREQAGLKDLPLLGALHLQDVVSGVEFDLGSGFTHEQRVELWAKRAGLKGQLVKYKYQPVGVKAKPRFPVFLGFRHD